MRAGKCPSCGASIDFAPGAGKVKVCEHCHTVVLRGKANLESLGKVAELADTESPLTLGLAGRYQNRDFTIVGRIQKRNKTGTWDEWCLSMGEPQLDGGPNLAWLAQSEGEWNIMLPVLEPNLPALDTLSPMTAFRLKGQRFVVEERNSAQTVSAEGQLPEFNKQHEYVDATGPSGAFVSLDAGDGFIEAFVGERVTLNSLGFDPHQLAATPRQEALSQARCTQCNGMLELKAPDIVKRVACPYCGALLDVSHGQLSFLQLLEKPPLEPFLALGSAGKIDNVSYTVLAFLIRSCTVDGTRYPWEEYLLWHREHGFRWLMRSNNHWTLLTPTPLAAFAFDGTTPVYQGKKFKAYQQVMAVTEYVVGECYWTVSAGEMATATEYVLPPMSVNFDETATEVTATVGRMLSGDELQRAFSLKNPPPAAHGVAPAQVNPYTDKAAELWKWTGLWVLGLLAVVLAFSVLSSSQEFVSEHLTIPPGAASASAEAQRFSKAFTIAKDTPLKIAVEVPDLDNNWLGLSVDLVNEATGEVVSVYAESSRYSGVDDGESWSEGSRGDSKITDVVKAGDYVLRATPSFDAKGEGMAYRVTVNADGGPGFCLPFCFLLLLLAFPVFTQFRASGFESRRWADSSFSSKNSSAVSSSDDDSWDSSDDDFGGIDD